MKKSWRLCLIALVLLLTLAVSAAANVVDSGTCGSNLTWTLDNVGTLTIDGTGGMYYYSYSRIPWYSYRASIKNVVIGDGVTSIGWSAFSGCSSLTSVTIPDSVTGIGSGVFCGCSNLSSVTIPNSVTSIGDYAFDGCSGLTSVTIPDSVTSIGFAPFSNCSCLTTITVDADNSHYANDERGVLFNKNKTELLQYPIGNTAERYEIPDSVTSIGNRAFSGCPHLSSVSIGKNVATIGDFAFEECFGLSSVAISDHMVSIGESAFDSCFDLKSVYITDLSAWCKITFNEYDANPLSNGADLYINNELALAITIPDDITTIGEYVFMNCPSLTSVTISANVTGIGMGAFDGCKNLSALTLSDNVTTIDNYAFYGCSSLTSVTIPANVTSIGPSAFEGCSGLTSVTIPDSVTSIGRGAFRGCSGLTSVTIPTSVASIGDYTFFGCSTLTSVTIPTSVTSIGDDAFSRCSSLTSVTIPASVTSIGDFAFHWCSQLKDIYYTGTKDEWDKIKIESNNYYLTRATIHYQAAVLFPFVSQTADETVYTVKTANLPDGVVVVVALYKDGRFVGYENAVCGGDTLTIATAILHDRAVIMAWDGLDTMKPLSPAVKI